LALSGQRISKNRATQGVAGVALGYHVAAPVGAISLPLARRFLVPRIEKRDLDGQSSARRDVEIVQLLTCLK
jgi:hypothetical protein